MVRMEEPGVYRAHFEPHQPFAIYLILFLCPFTSRRDTAQYSVYGSLYNQPANFSFAPSSPPASSSSSPTSCSPFLTSSVCLQAVLNSCRSVEFAVSFLATLRLLICRHAQVGVKAFTDQVENGKAGGEM